MQEGRLLAERIGPRREFSDAGTNCEFPREAEGSPDSNLALDSNLDSYHVQNIVVERLPALVSQLGEMQTFLRAASSTEAVSSAQAARLALLDTSIRIRSTIDGVKSDLEAAYRGNADGSVRRNIDAAIMTMIARVESYLSTIGRALPMQKAKSIPLLSKMHFPVRWGVRSELGLLFRPN